MPHHARGNSPASSSSGSGSGTWSIPITPRDSMATSTNSHHLLPPTHALPLNRNLPKSRVTFASSGSGSGSVSEQDSCVGAGSAHRLVCSQLDSFSLYCFLTGDGYLVVVNQERRWGWFSSDKQEFDSRRQVFAPFPLAMCVCIKQERLTWRNMFQVMEE